MTNDRALPHESTENGGQLRSNSLNRIAVVVLIALVVLAFSPTLFNDFVEWDDDHVIVNNEAYRGFSLSHLKWMFQTGFAGHYQPLTWLSYAFDIHIWGLDPFGFHLTNLVLHIVVSVGFYFIAHHLIRSALPQVEIQVLTISSLAAATIFAVHPLRVESVAWATERRDVLSGAWIVITVLLYLHAVSQPSTARRWAILSISALCYVLSLLSKAAGMPLPLVFLVMDYYPLRRLRFKQNPVQETNRTAPKILSLSRPTNLTVLIEKLLFLIPAIAFAPLAIWAQNSAGALRSFEDHPLSLRIGQAFYGLVFYPLTTLWPSNLVPLYEQRADAQATDSVFVISATVVIASLVLVFAIRKRFPALLASTLVYLLWIAPVLGLAQSGPQVVADRYSYLACMPWAVLLGGLIGVLARRTQSIANAKSLAIACAIVVVTCALIMTARSQSRIWSDSYTLWSTTVERAPDTPTAHANLAILLNNRGEFELAKEHALTTLKFLPANRSAHLALGLAYFELGEIPSAEKHYRYLIERDEQSGRSDDGITAGLSVVLTRLAVVLNSAGRFDEAEALYRRAIEVKPTDPALQINLAGFLASRDRDAEALEWLEESLKIDPTNALACYRASVLQLEMKDEKRAIKTLSNCAASNPNDGTILAQLALILATAEDTTLREPERAFFLANNAMSQSKGLDPLAVEAMAAAHAAKGNYRDAVATLNLLLSNPEVNLSQRTRERLNEKMTQYEVASR